MFKTKKTCNVIACRCVVCERSECVARHERTDKLIYVVRGRRGRAGKFAFCPTPHAPCDTLLRSWYTN